MSVNAIMKNILSFGEILSQSCGQEAQNWGSQSLQNAVRWAAYCEEICKQAAEKGCGEELDRHVRGLVIYLKPATCMHLSGDTLSNASQLLRKNLLQNPYISDELFEQVLTLYRSEDDSFGSLIKECSEIACRKASVQTVDIIQAIFTPSGGAGQGRSLAKSQGEQLLQHLIQQKKLNLDHINRFWDYVTRVCKQLIALPKGSDAILWVVLADPGDCTVEVLADEIKQQIISWIVHSKANWLPMADVTLLPLVCAVSEQFFHHYLGSLVSWGEEMLLEYGQPGAHPLYTWRPNPNKLSSPQTFAGLVSHWSQLLSKNNNMRAAARNRLEKLSLPDDPNIWRDIRKQMRVSKENET